MGRRRPYWGDDSYSGRGGRSTSSRVGSALQVLGGAMYDYSSDQMEAQQRTAQDERNFEQQKELQVNANTLANQSKQQEQEKQLARLVGVNNAKAVMMYTSGELPTPLFKKFLKTQGVEDSVISQIPDTPDDIDMELATKLKIKPEDFAVAAGDIADSEQKKNEKQSDLDAQLEKQKEAAKYSHDLGVAERDAEWQKDSDLEDADGNVIGQIQRNRKGDTRKKYINDMKPNEKVVGKKGDKDTTRKDVTDTFTFNDKIAKDIQSGGDYESAKALAQKFAKPNEMVIDREVPKLTPDGVQEVDENDNKLTIKSPTIVPKDTFQNKPAPQKNLNDPRILKLKQLTSQGR